MKRIIKHSVSALLSLIAFVFFSCNDAVAQTYFAPFDLQNHSEPVRINNPNGMYFVGKKHWQTLNGQVQYVKYYGTIVCTDGTKLITESGGNGLDENLNFYNGTYWIIEPDGQITRYYCVNGEDVSSETEYRNYIIYDNCIQFTVDYTGGGGYSGGSNAYSGSSSSSHSSNRICQACHGKGIHQACKGTGKMVAFGNKHITTCTSCHGTGKCPNCNGLGHH